MDSIPLGSMIGDLDRHPAESVGTAWQDCRFLTCSVLPVGRACNLRCPFCFSKSSLSALRQERPDWTRMGIDRYYAFARERGATRLVVTGGGEPLLRADDVCYLIRRGAAYFDEVACFTNGSYVTAELARRLADAGLTYLCYSRHHHDDDRCRQLMGLAAPTLNEFFRAAGTLRVRATCVMARGSIDSIDLVDEYIERLSAFGVREFTFKHTYTAYAGSVFGTSAENRWAREHQIEFDPYAGRGRVVLRLPWGPVVRHVDGRQVCYYHEPTPDWEQENRLCRSSNLMSDGTVYASLEDRSSRLFRLTFS
jgi:cyclic pyranopterin phosphate synthase